MPTVAMVAAAAARVRLRSIVKRPPEDWLRLSQDHGRVIACEASSLFSSDRLFIPHAAKKAPYAPVCPERASKSPENAAFIMTIRVF
jgi:hypothetical protein